MAKVINKYNEIYSEFSEQIKILCVFGKVKKDVIFVTNDDKVYGFGENRNKCLGLGDEERVSNPKVIEELCQRKISTFTFGDYHALALTENGYIYSWGSNDSGQLGYEIEVNEFKPKLINSLSEIFIKQICCGSQHSLALSDSGKVYAWGHNNDGQLGIYSDKNKWIPVQLKFNGDKVISIASGYHHSLVLTDSGHVLSWGSNTHGQLGRKKYCVNTIPLRILSDKCFVKICCGFDHSLILSNDGIVYGFGSNFYGQIGNERIEEEFYTPVEIELPERISDITTIYHLTISVAKSDSGKYYYWGHQNICVPRETKHESINEIFYEFFELTHQPVEFAPIQKFIDFRSKTISESNAKNEEFTNSQNSEDLNSTVSINMENEISKELTIDKETNSEINIACDTDGYPVQAGKYVKEFIELRLIARGAFGSVFQVQHKVDHKTYAIKQIKIIKNNDNEKHLKELRILVELENDYVVRYYDSWIEVFSADPTKCLLYIRTEFCCQTLESVIVKINSELKQTERNIFTRIGYYISSALCEEILIGVKYLHKQKPPIIHRDLKPNNILITDGTNGKFVKIADFGISTVHDKHTHTQGLGTDGYMAFEVYDGNYNTKADIYSLGVILGKLFNIDLNELASDLKIGDSSLEHKVKHINGLITKCLNVIASKRPNCDEILSEKHDWSMDLGDIKSYYNLEALEENPDIFHLYFIQKKLENL